MEELLKGNYKLDQSKIESKDDQLEDINSEFSKKALNSIGGSMVFVEREKFIWNGDE